LKAGLIHPPEKNRSNPFWASQSLDLSRISEFGIAGKLPRRSRFKLNYGLIVINRSMQFGSEIIVIGGGVIGLATAIELRLQGAEVTVLSKDFQAAAGHAAAGMLAPQAERIPSGSMLDLCG
jgi:FAD dependent oxidoreductase